MSAAYWRARTVVSVPVPSSQLLPFPSRSLLFQLLGGSERIFNAQEIQIRKYRRHRGAFHRGAAHTARRRVITVARRHDGGPSTITIHTMPMRICPLCHFFPLLTV